ncbi:MAG: hypothetical protein Q4B54_11400 [Coriobacteriales bacterium]|nr:hypothetical protein [Coriobacteriales bacterium]
MIGGKAIHAACGAIVLSASLLCGCSSSTSIEQTAEQPAQEQAAEQPAQVFDNEFATAEYRDTIDSTGNAVVNFALTNKTSNRVMVASENIVVNDQFNVQSLGGSVAPIDPGNTGSVSLVFGVSVQTTLAGVSDMHKLSADLVLHDESTFDVVGSVHVDVTI